MNAVATKESHAVVYAAGGNKALADAISEGIANAKVLRSAQKIKIENDCLQHDAEFWKGIALIRKRQVYENTMQRIKNEEARKSLDFLNPRFCLFLGFACGAAFATLLCTLAVCGCFGGLPL